MPQGGRLDPAAALVDGVDPDHMEGVKDGGSVFKLVVGGVHVATEQVQGRDLDAPGELLPAALN